MKERPPCSGVLPSAKAIYPGGHTQLVRTLQSWIPTIPDFVLVDCGEWGCETQTMFTLAKFLGKNIPVVTVVVDGGVISKEEVRQSVRQKWPIIVIEKTGRVADEIAAAWKEKQAKNQKQKIDDPALAQIIETGNISIFSLDDSVEMFREL